MSLAATCSQIVQIPGPQGATGSAGTNGTNGENAFTLTTGAFAMPAELGSSTVNVVSSAAFIVGQIAALEFLGVASPNNFGYFQVTAKPSATQVTLKNLRDTPNSAYLTNAIPGIIAPTGSKLTPGGLQGPDGVDGVSGAPSGATFLTKSADAGLSGEIPLDSLAGPGLLKFAADGTPSKATDGTDFLSPATGLEPADIGVIIQAFSTLLAAIAAEAPTVADRLFYTTGINTVDVATLTSFIRTLLDDATALAARTTLELAPLPYFTANRANIDQAAVVTATPTKIQFNNEVLDSNANYDPVTNYRFTPTKSGLYRITVAVTVKAMADGNTVQAKIYKNGAVIAVGTSQAASVTDVQAIVDFVSLANGTTDYFEAYVFHDGGVNKDIDGTNEETYFGANWAGQ